MKIFVRADFKQQEGDTILYEYGGVVALEVADESLYEEYRVSMSAEEIEEIEKTIAKELTKELNELCDSKSRGAKAIIAGMAVSPEQLEEYQMVADAVDREDVEWFADEAEVLGTTAQEEFDKAKASKIGYLTAFEAFKKLIRVYRRWNSKNIDDRNFTLARAKIEEAREIGVELDENITPTEAFAIVKAQVDNIIKGE